MLGTQRRWFDIGGDLSETVGSFADAHVVEKVLARF
jgi:hypothetical protein